MQAKAVAILVILTFIAAWTIRGWKEGHDRADAVQAERDHLMQTIAMFQDKAQEAERVINEYRDKQPTVNEIVKVINRPVYKSDCIDDDGLRVIEKAANVLPGEHADKVPQEPAGPER